MKKYVFVCPYGDLWAQIAAAIFNHLADPRIAYAIATGVDPAPAIHPSAIRVLEERGLRLAPNAPFRITLGFARGSELIVSLGCERELGHIPGFRRVEWAVPDADGDALEQVRSWRNQVGTDIRALVNAEGVNDVRSK